ncbi:unnamed protein product [Meloidogyne enterolobii]|uniref:Uncharacterized protein n=2 Tax=Meloidogyne enterolobii TaxID=390850 RepID=A0ACB0Y768_MELEN
MWITKAKFRNRFNSFLFWFCCKNVFAEIHNRINNFKHCSSPRRNIGRKLFREIRKFFR